MLCVWLCFGFSLSIRSWLGRSLGSCEHKQNCQGHLEDWFPHLALLWNILERLFKMEIPRVHPRLSYQTPRRSVVLCVFDKFPKWL